MQIKSKRRRGAQVSGERFVADPRFLTCIKAQSAFGRQRARSDLESREPRPCDHAPPSTTSATGRPNVSGCTPHRAFPCRARAAGHQSARPAAPAARSGRGCARKCLHCPLGPPRPADAGAGPAPPTADAALPQRHLRSCFRPAAARVGLERGCRLRILAPAGANVRGAARRGCGDRPARLSPRRRSARARGPAHCDRRRNERRGARGLILDRAGAAAWLAGRRRDHLYGAAVAHRDRRLSGTQRRHAEPHHVAPQRPRSRKPHGP
jgi:hypothetical protein